MGGRRGSPGGKQCGEACNFPARATVIMSAEVTIRTKNRDVHARGMHRGERVADSVTAVRPLESWEVRLSISPTLSHTAEGAGVSSVLAVECVELDVTFGQNLHMSSNA